MVPGSMVGVFEGVTCVDVEAMSETDALDLVLALERERSRLDAIEGVALARLHARGTTDRRYGLRTPGWLARVAPMSLGTAKDRVRVGETLRRWLPVTAAALAAGEIGFDHARVMAGAVNDRNAELFGLAEGELVGLAGVMNFGRWRLNVIAAAQAADVDGAEPQDRPADRPRVRIKRSLDDPDVMELAARFVGGDRLVVEQVLNEVADRLFRRYTADSKVDASIVVPDRAVLWGEALVEICRLAQTIQTDRPGVAPRTDATLVIQAHDLTDVRDQEGVKLQHGRVGCLLCDSRLYPIVVSELGVPLDMGREVRLATRAQRRALKLRDGGCVFPGCEAHPDHCDAHHVVLWEFHDGRTNIAVLVLLCRHHHGVVHRLGWAVTVDGDGWATFTTPDGTSIDGQRHQRRRTATRAPTPTRPPC